MFGAIAGGIASALAGGAMSKLFGGGQKAASGGIQGDVLATDNNTVGMGDAGIKSAIQGSNVPNPDEAGKVSAEVDLVHQQTQNQRYGSSHIGATAKDISNVVTDAASGVVDIFHGIDK